MSLIKIGPYRLGKTLGVGSFSKVKMAVHEPTSRKVAIKILNRKKLHHMDMGQKVRREINILRLFMHSHIIRLYEVIDTSTDIFVVMEYVSGGELFDYIVSRGRLSESEARRFFQQIISGVEYCHSHMVVHRDLKPENLLLDDKNNVKIADFGLSNMMRDGYFLKTSCGSPNYAAPEVISGNLYAGPEVDVWSCGVILFALLCGSLPFDDENIPNLFKKIKEGIFTLPSYLSSGARDLIPKMLVVDPMKRITISEIRQHEWFKLNIPRYLQVSSSEEIQKNQIIDEDALEAVVKMGWTRENVLEALSMGPELLTNSELNNADDMRPMAVAYHLMLDQKRKIEQESDQVSVVSSTAANALASSVRESDSSPEQKETVHSASVTAASELDNGADAEAEAKQCPEEEMMSSNTQSSRSQVMAKALTRPCRLWYLGLRSRKDPARIMEEVFRVLKQLDLKWKVLTPYKLKVRCPDSSCDDIVKIGFQLYKTHTNTYVLDMQKLSGDMFPFMDLCTKFGTILQL